MITITIDFDLQVGDVEPAREAIKETLDELIGEALAGGAFEFAGDVEVLGYDVIDE